MERGEKCRSNCYQQQQDMTEQLLYFLRMGDFTRSNMLLKLSGEEHLQ